MFYSVYIYMVRVNDKNNIYLKLKKFNLKPKAEWSRQLPNYNIATELQAIRNTGLPLVIGEFADKHSAYVNNKYIISDIDARLIMAECQKHGFGYLGWSWCGNGKDDAGNDLGYLDMVNSKNWSGANGFSSWGLIILDDTNGIRRTSSLATVFL